MAKKKPRVQKPEECGGPVPGGPTKPLRCDIAAFPRPAADRDYGASGMTLRDYFASAAGAAMYGNPELLKKAVDEWSFNGGPRPHCVAEWFAGMAYEFADKMIEARK